MIEFAQRHASRAFNSNSRRARADAPVTVRPSPGGQAQQAGRPERAATPAHALYIPLSPPHPTPGSFIRDRLREPDLTLWVHKSAPRWRKSANDGKTAVPYRTYREARYLSVSTE